MLPLTVLGVGLALIGLGAPLIGLPEWVGLIAFGLGVVICLLAGVLWVRGRRQKPPPPPPGPKPALRLSASSVSQLQSRVPPKSFDREIAQARGHTAVAAYSTPLEVRETNDVRARGVSVRIARTNPTDNQSYPIPMSPDSESPSMEFDLTAGGLRLIEVFRCVELDDGTLDGSAPGIGTAFFANEIVEFDVEALIGDEISDARRFRVENFAQRLPNGYMGVYPWPTITEIGPVS